METDALNHLADETSPYLQDHADNPVDWYPWGDEALEKARREDKPIFLSIGYSACHWCHVMKRESFQDEETARLMNENFVNIKVDREERPDLDEIYMQAVQSMTGRGGWPMSVFLTPKLKPFYGGTYFPPEPRQGMPAFREVLQRVRNVYDEKRDDIEERAEDITRNLEQLEDLPVAEDVPGSGLVQRTYNQLEDRFDARYGGFGSSPKFPRVMDGQLLARLQGEASEYPRAGEMLSSTLDHMMRGGIYDQVGGGFSRYSTDRQWLVPHFEKMLYDNAQLVDLYTVSYRIFDEPRYRRVVEETLTYVDREMTHPEGAFYSTQDAESEGEEGKYYVWSHEEFMEKAGENASLLADYWGVTEEGNFEGKNILHVEQPPEAFCADRDLDVDTFRTILEDARDRLLEVREQRVKPGRDEKILTDWNGLMAAACARAGFFLHSDEYVNRARRCLEFLHENLRVDDEWQHTYKDGRAHTPAFLDDYAFLVKAHLELFQVSGEHRWLERALELYDRAMDQFWDDDGGGFYVTGPRHKDVPVRSRSPQDKAQPSGNSEMALNALKLAGLTGDPDYRSHAGTIFRAFDRYLDKAPTSMTRMMCALFDYHEGGREILVRGTDSEREPFLDRLRRRYLPGAVLFQADAEGRAELTTLLEGREDGPSPAVYVCRRGTCRRPVTEPDELPPVLEQTADEES